MTDRSSRNIIMAYNSMDAMLMGGIVPSQITKRFVLDFMEAPFKRVKKMRYEDYLSEGNSWVEIIRGFNYGDSDIDKVASAITNYLRISAQYGLIGGPNSLLRLRSARVDLINLRRPLVDIAIRIMKDMRRSDANRMDSLRTQFIREQSVPRALRLMQFAPGFGYYDDELAALPASLQERLDKYQNPAKAGAAIRRALKRRAAYPQLTRLETFETHPYDLVPTQILRQRRDMIPIRQELSDKRKAGLKQAQEKIAARDLAYYQGLTPEIRDFI